ncbi:MAG: hypothetical protein IT515_09720 [Burkholderiales bacterium]|nr:hypothetical protein [Burkholderiales bacterium]
MPRFLAKRHRNTVSIIDSGYVEIVGLELDGLGLSVDAVKAEGHARFAHDITLEDLLIHGHGSDQQDVGISTKCPAWNWVIRGNVILGAGTGIYLGSSDGSAPFVAGIIEYNLVRDTRGYNLQIKHQNSRPALPGLPEGQSVTVIRHNVFSKAENGATAELARPNVLVGHFPKTGAGADDAYLVFGNFFYENPTEALFQGEGNIALYSNVLVSRSGSAIHIQPHNGLPEQVDVFGNTVIARDDGILITGGDPKRTQRAFGNLVFAGAPLPGGYGGGNVTGELPEATQWLRNPTGRLGELDLAPIRASTTALSDWPLLPKTYTDAGRDFEGRSRASRTAGAYATGQVAWPLAIERKPRLNPDRSSSRTRPR